MATLGRSFLVQLFRQPPSICSSVSRSEFSRLLAESESRLLLLEREICCHCSKAFLVECGRVLKRAGQMRSKTQIGGDQTYWANQSIPMYSLSYTKTDVYSN